MITAITVIPGASAQLTAENVAVIDFTVVDQAIDKMYASMATDAVVVEMLRTGKFNITPAEIVKSKLEEFGLRKKDDKELRVSISETMLQRIGQETGADRVLTGEVASIEIDRETNQASARIRVKMLDVVSGEWINGSIATGKSNKRLGYSQDKDSDLIIEAINNAALKVVDTMAKYIIPFGTILGSPADDEALINQGTQQGIMLGMKMIVLRRNETGADDVVGHIRITSVGDTDAMAKVIDAIRGIKPGDRVMAIYTPPKDTGKDVERPKTSKEEKIAKGSKLLMGLGVLLGLLALTTKGREAEGTMGGISMSVGSRDAQSIDGSGNGLLIAWDIPGNILSSNILEYHIWRDTSSSIGNAPIFAGTYIGTPLYNNLLGNYDFSVIDNMLMDDDTVTWRIPVDDGTSFGAAPNSPAAIIATQPGESHPYFVSALYRLDIPSSTGGTLTRYRETVPAFIGRSTYLLEPELISPGDNTGTQELALSNITFTWNSVAGATDYVIEVSSTMDFQRDKTWVSRFPRISPTAGVPISATFTNVLSLSTELSDVPSGGVLYWRVGCKNNLDTYAPFPATPNATMNGTKNTRYVYTDQMGLFSFKRL